MKETGAIKHIGIDPEKYTVIMIISIAKTEAKKKRISSGKSQGLQKGNGFPGLKVQFEETRKLEASAATKR